MSDVGKIISIVKSLGVADPDVIREQTSDWLDDHPEATTTVQDGAISRAKLDADLKEKTDEVGVLKSALNFQTKTINLLTNATLKSGYKIDGNGSLSSTSTHNTYEITYDGSYEKFNATTQSNSTYDQKAIAFYNSENAVISTVAFSSTTAASVFEDVEVPEGTSKIYLSGRTSASFSATASIEYSKRISEIEEDIEGIHPIPSGGTQGQVLAKSSGTDYEVEWVDQSEGGEIDDTAGAGDTDKTWSADKLTKEIGQINDELNFQPTSVNLLTNATHTYDKKVNSSGEIESDTTAEIFEISVDGSFSKFNATVYSNTLYQIKAITFYNSNNGVISSVAFTTTSDASTYTAQEIPEGTAKIILCNKNGQGTASASYAIDRSKRLLDIEDNIADNTAEITAINAALPLSTTNLYNPDTAVSGFVNTSTGAIASDSSHTASDYIEVEPDMIYTFGGRRASDGKFDIGGARYALYTSGKVFISGAQDYQFRTPSNAAYARISLLNTIYDRQFVRRSFLPKYVPYKGHSINDESASMRFNLPRNVYAALDLECDLYTFAIHPGRHDFEYNSDYRFTKGGSSYSGFKNYGRFLRVNESNSSVERITAYADYQNTHRGASKAFRVAMSDPEDLAATSVLIMGDSTTANGFVAQYLHEYEGNENKITTVGTLGTSPYMHEGRSGWRLHDYFTQSSNNPFYNPSTQTFDAAYYFDNTGVSVPDVFIVNLGINDGFYGTGGDSTDSMVSTFIEEMAAVIESVHGVSATTKVAVCIPLPPNVNQYSFGVDGITIIMYDQYRFNNLLIGEALIDAFDYRQSEGTYLVPINAAVDMEYNVGFSDQLPNARATETVSLPAVASSVHPISSGYHQIADEIYAFLCSLT